MSMNHIAIIGRLTATPMIERTESGVSRCTITVAVDRNYTPKGAEKQTDFFSVTAWRHSAEFLASYGDKGRMVAVEGEMQGRKYVDNDGNNRTFWGIQASNVYLVDSPRKDRPEDQGAPATFQEVQDDGDLPF